MYVAHLEVRDFRSYEAVDLTLEPGASAFVGPNGQGKTNLLEAVGYAATLGSHRVATDAPLVRHGADRAIIRTGVRHPGRSALVEIEINPGKANRARLNRAPVPRPRDILGTLRTVFFAPEDLALVKGDPSERRRFLDELLVARTPRYAAVRADYERVLRQRNALLKSAAGAHRGRGSDVTATLDVWDTHLSRSGAELLAARIDLTASVQPLVENSYHAIAGAGGSVELQYHSNVGADAELGPEPASDLPDTTSARTDETSRAGDEARSTRVAALAESMRAELARNRRAELERGVSLVGPHRDDLVLRLGDMPARGYASQGESWSLALGLRLAAYGLLRGDGVEPVLVLDDVFAELDIVRRARLAELVAPSEQALVTAAVADDVPEELSGARFDVGYGRAHRVR